MNKQNEIIENITFECIKHQTCKAMQNPAADLQQIELFNTIKPKRNNGMQQYIQTTYKNMLIDLKITRM